MATLREGIQAAISSGKIETPSAAPAASSPTSPAPAAPAATTAPAARDATGRFAGKADGAAGVVASSPGSESAPGAPSAGESSPSSPADGKPTPPKYKPPQSWKPAVREKWATLPEEVQEEIDRVEKAAADRIRRAAEAEKGYGAFRQALTPYEAQLRAGGKGIPEALGEALKLVSAVRSGSPQERAAALANLVTEAEQAGVGLDSINAILSQQGQPPAAPKPQEFRDPRFDQFMAQMAQRERAKTAQVVTEFASNHEFFADVQDDIAGLMEAGIAKDLQTAYDYAVALPKHREIGAVLEQRRAADEARTGEPAIARAQAAASTVRASPVTAPGVAPKGLRATLERNLARK